MKASSDHILTSHAGSLPRPDALIEAWGANDEHVLAQELTAAVAEVVRRQKELGIDVPGDGEFGKPMAQRVNYGSWWRYSWSRLGGLDPSGPSIYEMEARRSRPGQVVLTSFGDRRDRTRFAAAYGDPDSGITTGPRPPAPICIAPIHYAGHEAIKADIARFKAALSAAGVEEGFMTAVAPASASRIGNSYYKTEEELLYACADAMREEYKAILDAGLILQLDDPAIAENWDQINPEPSVEDYRKFTMVRVEALNHAIRGLPQDRIRFHLCWGSWHGPHTTDIPMRDIVEVMLAINAQAYSFEAGNVRHEHEWKVWQDVKLPDGKMILPGVVSHATNVVEHPELVAERILRFAKLVGRERVIASTDCGLGGRIHPQIAWAKLGSLVQGAALASRQLWAEPMRQSSDHILTSHVGSLPRPDALIEANRAREVGEATDEPAFRQTLRMAVDDVVRRQKELGINAPGDGEFGKPVGNRVNYGAWWNYAFQRLGGLELGGPGLDHMAPRLGRPGEIVLTNAARRRDRVRFSAAYSDPVSGVFMGPRPTTGPICVSPLIYTGQEAIAADIANFKAALAAAGVSEGFMTAVAPGSAYRIPNSYYERDEDFLYACAEAMREEYKAILDAGLILQLDDPATATSWDMIDPEPSVEDYKKFIMVRVEALNHALRGLPQDRIRFHLCWGSWHGPHTTDIPMRDIVEIMLAVNAGAYSFEAGNVRHEHEWRVWQDVKLPDGKLILPGVVSHATNVVEHPELVADRIVRFANLVGRERVIASTDCGLGGRVHPDIAWAKLDALAQGAALASRQLWP